MTRCSLLGTWMLMTAMLMAGTSSSASAQADMSFGEEEVAVVPQAPTEGPPSPELTEALRLYAANEYAPAAIIFQRIIDGETTDGPGNVHKAQFFLGKCFYHLRFYQSALVIFDEIGALGEGHLFFAETLQWLVQLASQLPEPAGIIEKIGRYGVASLEAFNTPASVELYNQLLYLMGRYLYQDGDFEQAAELFGRVAPSSVYFVDAKFFQGITNVRLRRARPAVRALRAILEGLDDGTVQTDDPDRVRNLAWISLARVYYTAANRVDPATGDREVDGTLLGQAVESWNQVSVSSEYWLDAMFESSWAFFLADQFSRALGNVHSLESPYFPQAYYPEALVIKAVTFFVNCQIDNAEATIREFHERYDPVRDELEATLQNFQDNTAFFEFLTRVRSGEADISPRIRGLVSSAMSDRTLLQNVEYVRVLDAEEARLSEMTEAFQNSGAGSRVLQDVALAKSFAVDQTGDLARGRYNRLIDELMDLSNQVDTVEVEIVSFRRDELDQEQQQQFTDIAAAAQGDVVVDEEHQMWPFDGEYWRDELGFYRQQVTNQCGR